LFASQGYDLKPVIRSSQQPEALTQAIAAIWSQRTDRYSELRQQEPALASTEDGTLLKRRKVEMSYIGG
jgi:cyclic pyranopterin phosphate synthase